jgi:triphosphoribosyl-dephospho-CoA synthase
LADGIEAVLAALTAEDAAAVYEAIRRVQPGGLGHAQAMDVHARPPRDLRAAMQSAADRDLVAAQYANGFREVLQVVAPAVAERSAAGWSLSRAVIRTHVQMLARFPDSLIARKGGRETAEQAAVLAQRVLDAEDAGPEQHDAALSELEFWLRSDGNRRNPGTTADLIAAALFTLLRENQISPPYR